MADDLPNDADRRTRLLWLRDLLETTLPSAEASNRAALAKQYRDTLAELDSMRVPEVSALDDLAAARRARLSAEVPKRSAAQDKRGTGSNRPGGKRRDSA